MIGEILEDDKELDSEFPGGSLLNVRCGKIDHITEQDGITDGGHQSGTINYSEVGLRAETNRRKVVYRAAIPARIPSPRLSA